MTYRNEMNRAQKLADEGKTAKQIIAMLDKEFPKFKLLEDSGYTGSLHFDAHAYRTESYAGVEDFARGCMRTYLILKEKAEQFGQDQEIQSLLAEINADNGEMFRFTGQYTLEKAQALKAHPFDRKDLAARPMGYERLDQLVIELLLGAR